MKKKYFGNCVDNPFNTPENLCLVIDNAKEITKQAFMRNCFIEKGIKGDMKDFPNDYTYYKNGDIYFYVWSMIEYFYK